MQSEFIGLVRKRLEKGGILAWWNADINSQYLGAVYWTLREHFPVVSLKRLSYSNLFYASNVPFNLNLTVYERKILVDLNSGSRLVNSISRPIFI